MTVAELPYEKRDREIGERLRAYIATTPQQIVPVEGEDYHTVVEDFWDILGIHCGGYGSDVDDDIIKVMEAMHAQVGNTSSIASHTGLSEPHVELIQYILCSAGMCDYGTSPRGCWLIHTVKDLVPEIVARWRKEWDDA